MTVSEIKGKKAITNYKTLKVFNIKEVPKISLIECQLETGRTHQIRVHMSSIGHSLIGDKIYGGFPKTSKKQTFIEQNIISQCKISSRQALHSKTLSFQHPILKEKMH